MGGSAGAAVPLQTFNAEAALPRSRNRYAASARYFPSTALITLQQIFELRAGTLSMTPRSIPETGHWWSHITWGVIPPSPGHPTVGYICWQTCCDTIRLKDPQTGKEVEFIIVDSCRREMCGGFETEIGAGELVPT